MYGLFIFKFDIAHNRTPFWHCLRPCPPSDLLSTALNRKLSNVPSIEKIEIANGKISSGVLVVTDLIPEGKNAFAFIITSGTNIQSHTAQIWKNINNGSVNVSFKLWSEATLVMNGTVSGILLCI